MTVYLFAVPHDLPDLADGYVWMPGYGWWSLCGTDGAVYGAVICRSNGWTEFRTGDGYSALHPTMRAAADALAAFVGAA